MKIDIDWFYTVTWIIIAFLNSVKVFNAKSFLICLAAITIIIKTTKIDGVRV